MLAMGAVFPLDFLSTFHIWKLIRCEWYINILHEHGSLGTCDVYDMFVKGDIYTIYKLGLNIVQ